jgi:ribonuclease HII
MSARAPALTARGRAVHRPRDAHLGHEYQLRRAGFRSIAGLDEVGRGSLARPRIRGLRDSKVLARSRRESLYEEIVARADAIGVGCVEVEVIDRINILEATRLAMREALAHLPRPPDHLLIDALTIREAAYPQRAIIDGDAISASIAAASIVAKVTRDRICDEMDAHFPGYGFARHKGYGTRRHYAALIREGPCAWHRRSFAPIRMLLAGVQLPLDLEFADLPLVDEAVFEPIDD